MIVKNGVPSPAIDAAVLFPFDRSVTRLGNFRSEGTGLSVKTTSAFLNAYQHHR